MRPERQAVVWHSLIILWMKTHGMPVIFDACAIDGTMGPRGDLGRPFGLPVGFRGIKGEGLRSVGFRKHIARRNGSLDRGPSPRFKPKEIVLIVGGAGVRLGTPFVSVVVTVHVWPFRSSI